LAIILFFAVLARAGGPKDVAGSSFFNPATMGQPLIWSGGQVNYYTDQGDLSPILPNSAANAFVATAFAGFAAMLPISAAFMETSMTTFNRLMLFQNWI